jgi:hypothetical protein
MLGATGFFYAAQSHPRGMAIRLRSLRQVTQGRQADGSKSRQRRQECARGWRPRWGGPKARRVFAGASRLRLPQACGRDGISGRFYQGGLAARAAGAWREWGAGEYGEGKNAPGRI